MYNICTDNNQNCLLEIQKKNSYIHVQISYHVPALKDKDKKTSQELQMMSSVTVIVRSGGNFFSKIVKDCQKV